ncbi:MAG: hypothetical protein RIR51_1235 [Bacteroidota bacterium]
MKKLIGFFLLINLVAYGQGIPYSVQMTNSLIAKNMDSLRVKPGARARWDYESGLFLRAVEQVYERTGDARYFDYIKKIMDQYINEDGTINTYKKSEYNSDNLPQGRPVLYLYKQLGTKKYLLAAQNLRDQLNTQPRTQDGGFWHKDRYPNQMWLDGLYMVEPYYGEYSVLFNEKNWDDILKQFELMYNGALDKKTGLIYHAIDASKKMPWADKKTGQSPNFWGRSIGWYMMALVDVLDYIPQDHKAREISVKQLNDLSSALLKVQDPKSHLWYQLPVFGGKEGNYLEASCSTMFTYSLLKGVRMGYLSEEFREPAKSAYSGIIKEFITKDPDGSIHLEKTVSVGGLGGSPYRSGSYDYYLSEPIRRDDLKGVGPFILASVEMEILNELSIGSGKKVVLDYYYNNEYKTNDQGEKVRFHYTWEDSKDSGFELWGRHWKEMGAEIASLDKAPTAENLKDADVYIIVDPDSPRETENPNYINQEDAKEIKKWIENGGSLLILANDTTNCDIEHLNILGREIGIEFVAPNLNFVQGREWEQGRVDIPKGNKIFNGLKKIYIKEISSLKLTKTGECLVYHQGQCVIAEAQIGKGKVVAVGDPWLYNEYTNNRRLPLEYENLPAARKLATYLLGH